LMPSVQFFVEEVPLITELVPHLLSSLQVLARNLVEQVLVLVYHRWVWAFAQTSLFAHSLHQNLLLWFWVAGLGPDVIVFCQSTLLKRSVVLAKLWRLVVTNEAFIHCYSHCSSLVRGHVSILYHIYLLRLL
jgi:hypothetical protein